MPEYAELAELIAQMILDPRRHCCGPDCLCWSMREMPAIKRALQELECKQVAHQ